MLGKTVRIRHCPATVSGSNYPAFVTAPGQPVWEGKCVYGCRKSGDRFSRYQLTSGFSEGEKVMAILTFLFFLIVSPAENLKGTILDPAGAVVAGAKVEIS